MSNSEKKMLIALTLSTVFTIFNIIAVLTGSAITYYSQIHQFLFDALPMLNFS